MNYGEIVNLGRHRLMCGDATKREDVYKLVGDSKIDLVLTDPPYGMKCQNDTGAIGGLNKKPKYLADLRPYQNRVASENDKKYEIKCKAYPIIIGDDSQESAQKNYEIMKDLTKNFIIWGGQYFANFLPVNGGWLFWDKNIPDKLTFSMGELAYCSIGARVHKYKHTWNGICREGKVSLNLQCKIHPTQKPVELHMKILQDFSKENDVILDCFGGSGTTLIACEQVNRTCLMMEISPQYCDIICERFNKLQEANNHDKTSKFGI